MKIKDGSLWTLGRKKSVNPAPSGTIAAAVFSDFLKFFSDDFYMADRVREDQGVLVHMNFP
jgi:hypothetical protein